MDSHNARQPELVIALVASIGCDVNRVSDYLISAVGGYGYSPLRIRVSREFRTLKPDLPDRETAPVYAGYKAYMDFGDELRYLLRRKDAALLPVLKKLNATRPLPAGSPAQPREAMSGTCIVISSLKTPEEVRLLRTIYRERVYVIAATAPENQRVKSLARRIRMSRYSGAEKGKANSLAVELVDRDEKGFEERPFGQNVRGAHALADLVVDLKIPRRKKSVAVTKTYDVRREVSRFVDLIFASPEHSPTREESAMYAAYGASLRSSSASRQVGTAIVTQDGQVVSLGSNESPKAGGGGYWEGDIVDARTIELIREGSDPSEELRDEVTLNLISVLGKAGLLNEFDAQRPTNSAVEAFERLRGWQRNGEDANENRHAMAEDSIEFFREVHAEMLAITDAARRGVSIAKCNLFSTTLPCHDCAKHILASGIAAVIYFEPYRKSRVLDLHADAVDVDGAGEVDARDEETIDKIPVQPFIGITPRLFPLLFRFRNRRRHLPFLHEAASLRIRDEDHDAAEPAVDRYDEAGGVTRETQALTDLALTYDETIKEETTKQEATSESQQSKDASA